MGTGKTTIGKELAKLTEKEFCDLDKVIEQSTHLSISDIFEKKGEAWFRELEFKFLKQIANDTNKVLATGGGVVLNQENRKIMRSRGIVVSLNASLETLWIRLRDNSDRPLLKGCNPKENLKQLYTQRASLYNEADYLIQVDGKEPVLIAKEIKQLIDSKIPI